MNSCPLRSSRCRRWLREEKRRLKLFGELYGRLPTDGEDLEGHDTDFGGSLRLQSLQESNWTVGKKMGLRVAADYCVRIFKRDLDVADDVDVVGAILGPDAA
ncbi:unnamed protein product [Linum trigynum]|uniref:Uncharacterized protein n=1 Tax=Linum trigynum TaxID=586398 RepID=A0AAV2G1N4_9ROSI